MNGVAAFKQSSVLPLLLGAVVAYPSTANGDPIVLAAPRIEFGLGSGGPGVQPDLVGSFFFEVSTGPGLRLRLFEVPVTAADVGRTFRVTAGSDPDFAAAAIALTDGIDAFHGYGLEFADGFWGTRSVTEGELFHRRLGFPDPDPDLKGFRLTAISVRLDELVVEANSTGRAVSLSGELSFEGAAVVPEPGTIALIGTGLLLGLRRTVRDARSRKRYSGTFPPACATRREM